MRQDNTKQSARYTGPGSAVQTGRQETADSPDQEEILRRKRRRQLREMKKARRARTVRRQKVLAAVLILVLILGVAGGAQLLRRAWARSTLSEGVLGYHELVKKYAKKQEISEYVDVLLAIMMVETEGTGKDVMQSSESKGLEINSLGPEESIEQACIYFAALVQIADNLEIDDDGALIQAYNFGPGYLTYVAKHGGKHRQELAIEYSKEMSDGEKVRYLHLYAIKQNGGWIYKFGNMFYEALVRQYL